MQISPPPPAMRSRVQDLGDSLIVHLRPRRSWGGLAFLTFWLTIWTLAGIAAIGKLVTSGWGDRAFLAVWLCVWAFGECAAGGLIAWQFFGREILTVTRGQLEVRQAIGKFSRTKRYEAALVRDVAAARVPSDEDEGPRKDFCLKVSYAEETVRIGEGLGERDAEHLASLVLARIRPRSRWGEEDQAGVFSVESRPAEEHVEAPAAGRPGRTLVLMAAGLIALFVIGVIRFRHDDASPPTRGASPPSAPQDAVPPPRDAFAAARTYASATTADLLRAGRTKMIGMPACTSDTSWTSWRCTVRAQATIGPFAGRTMRYYCDSRHVCGPDRPQGWNPSTSS